MSIEEWRVIDGYEEYQISDRGCIRTKRPPRHNAEYSGEWRLLRGSKLSGYPIVTLYGPRGSKIKKNLYIHRLLWKAFRGPLSDGEQIDHINRDRSDCRLSNLRVATCRENRVNTTTKPRHGYRGVFKSSTNRYRARLRTKAGRLELGSYPRAEEAALAYNIATFFHNGEFAVFNKIPPGFLP